MRIRLRPLLGSFSSSSGSGLLRTGAIDDIDGWAEILPNGAEDFLLYFRANIIGYAVRAAAVIEGGMNRNGLLLFGAHWSSG